VSTRIEVCRHQPAPPSLTIIHRPDCTSWPSRTYALYCTTSCLLWLPLVSSAPRPSARRRVLLLVLHALPRAAVGTCRPRRISETNAHHLPLRPLLPCSLLSPLLSQGRGRPERWRTVSSSPIFLGILYAAFSGRWGSRRLKEPASGPAHFRIDRLPPLSVSFSTSTSPTSTSLPSTSPTSTSPEP
jgi:hypothetical protein